MKTFTLSLAMLAIAGLAKAEDEVTLPTPVYENTFDSADERAECTIVGGGEYVVFTDSHGVAFQNAMSTADHTNYLLLPQTLFECLVGKTTCTICFWARLRDNWDGVSGYFYSPIFESFGEESYGATSSNPWSYPFFSMESRGLLQINCNGYCDFLDAQNDAVIAGTAETNYQGTYWLDDVEWHLVSTTIVAEGANGTNTADFCIDGSPLNSWTLNGGDAQTISGIFTTLESESTMRLIYNCLGGNQALGYLDADAPYIFDNFRIYDEALTKAQLVALYNAEVGDPNATYEPTAISNITTDAEVVSVEYFNLSGAKISEPAKGITLEKTTYSDGTTSVNKILK